MKNFLRHFQNIFKRLAPYLFILFVTLVFFYPVILQHKIPLPADALVAAHVPWTEMKWPDYPAGAPIKNLEISDSFSQFYPWSILIGQFWRAGKVPLWNSYMFSGAPFLATLHSGALYPLNLLHLFLSDSSTWTLYIIFQIFFSMLFMYWFLREINLKVIPSLFGALTFAFCGYMIAWLEMPVGGHAGLWLPLLLLFEHRLWKNKTSTLSVIPIVLVFFMIFTAGDFQVPIFVTSTYLLFGVYRFISTHSLKNIFLTLLGLLLGILLAAPQLLPTLELYLNSVRIGDPYIKAFNFGLLGWKKIVNFVWPDFFGNVVTGNYWGQYSYHEYIAFAGITTIVFAIVSLLTKKQSSEKFFWILLAISLIFLFPPIGYLPYKLGIPGLSTSSASRLIFLSDFCLATLGSFGLSKVLADEEGFKRLLKLALYFLGFSTLVVLSLLFISHRSSHQLDLVKHVKVAAKNILPSMIILTGLSAWAFLDRIKKLKKFVPLAILGLTTVELLFFAWKNTPFSPLKFVFPANSIIDYLTSQPKPFRIAGGIPTNLFMPFSIESAEGYDPLYPMLSGQWLSAADGGDVNIPTRRYGLLHNFSSPLLNYTNIEYVVDFKKGPAGDINKDGKFNAELLTPRFEQVSSFGRVAAFKNLDSLPRVYLTTDYVIEKDPVKIVELLTRKNYLAVLEKDITGIKRKVDFTSQVLSYNQLPNEVLVTASSSEAAVMVLSESYYPGWHAFIDGVETEIYKTNLAYKSVIFPQGEHRVEFIYEPESFTIGKWLFGATLTVLLGIAIYGQFTKRGRRTS